MKKLKFDNYLKGILLLAAGIFITFLPDLLAALFYIAGAAIIIYGIGIMIYGISKNAAVIAVPKGIIGIIIGLAIIAFPAFLKIGVPLIIGILFLVSGIDGIFTSISKKQCGLVWIPSIVSSILLIICGLFLIVNTGDVSDLFITIVGIILMLAGAAVIALQFLKSKNTPDNDSVINIDRFSVHDDNKK